jgi:3-oxoacyl-[acyl-carrier protein] reductase
MSTVSSRKVALVTGASSGIGAATAKLLAANGCNVALNFFRNRDGAAGTERECMQLGAEVLLLQGDIQSDEVCRQLAEQTLQRWGRLDILINNAGATVFSELDNWDALSGAMFQEIFQTNAVAAFQLVRACAASLKHNQGTIVNVSSAGGVLGRGSSVPYIMSKGALNSLTLYLARTLAPEVRVNAVCPGMVTSDWFLKGMGAEGYERIKSRFEGSAKLGVSNSPQDVAEAIMWLIGAKTVTGEMLMLDSGLHLS